MKHYFIFLITITLFLLGCNSEQQNKHDLTVLKGATMFDGNGNKIENSLIIIKEGSIQAVGDQELEIPSNAKILDFSGKFITPGLVDAHIHFSQTGFFDARPDVVDIRDSIDYIKLQSSLQKNPDRYFETYLRSGVTAVYDVGGYLWSVKLQSSAENNLNAPHVAAAGPLLTHVPDEYLVSINTPGQRQLFNLSSPDFGRKTVRQNTNLGSTGIKIWQINLEDPSFMESLKAVAQEVNDQGNKLIVHATALDQAKEALRLGAKVLVHSVEAQPIDDEFIKLAKDVEVIYCPTLIVHRGYYNIYKALQGEFIINDPNNAVDPETKNLITSANKFFKFLPNPDDYENMLLRNDAFITGIEKTMYDNLKRLHEAGVLIAVATDAGNPGTLHGISIYDEMEAMQEAGIPANDIIVMATKNGAKAMERFDDFGTLENGKMADLIIMNNDPSENISNMRSISHVMRGGLLRKVNEPLNASN
jgi:imidazolonepropionase-like amidohydrolase